MKETSATVLKSPFFHSAKQICCVLMHVHDFYLLFQLKKELSNFGPEFFDEIEDLKFNYREAVQKNVQYETQLEQISKQFGIDVKIPGL